jgi:hypothetical protein
MQEVKDSLQVLSDRVDEHFAEMKRSVEGIATDKAALKPSDQVNWSAGHTFEAELQSSRVYRNLGSRNSTYTYSSDARASMARSAFSNISLGNVSIVAVTYLRLWCADLTNAEHYRFGHHDPALESRLTELAELEPAIYSPVRSRIATEQGDGASDEDSASQYSRDEDEYALADDDPADGKDYAHVVDFGEKYTVADTLEAFVAHSWYGHMERDDSPNDHVECMDAVYTHGKLEDPLSDGSSDQQSENEEGRCPTTEDSMGSVLTEPVYLQDNLVELGQEEHENSEFIQEDVRIEVPGSPISDFTNTGSVFESLQATAQFDTTFSTDTEDISGYRSAPARISSILNTVEEEIEEHNMKDIHVADELFQNMESNLSCPSERLDISDDSQSTSEAAHTVYQKSDEHILTITTTELIGLVGISSLESVDQSRETRDSQHAETHHLAKCSADYSPQYDADTETVPLIKLKSNKKRRANKEKRRRRAKGKAGEGDGERADDGDLVNGAMQFKITEEEAGINQVEETITGRRDGANDPEDVDANVSDGRDNTERTNITTMDIDHTLGSGTRVTLDSIPGQKDTPPEEDVTKTPAGDRNRWCKDFLEKHDEPEEAINSLLEDLPEELGEMHKDALNELDESPLEAMANELSENGRREVGMTTEENVTTKPVEDCNDEYQRFLDEFNAQDVIVNTPDDTPSHEPEDASKHTNLDTTHFSEENLTTTHRCENFFAKPSTNPSNTTDTPVPVPASPSTYPSNNRDSGYMSLSETETNAETEPAIRSNRSSGAATHFEPQPSPSLNLVLSYRLTRAEYLICVSFALLLPCVVYDLCWATTVVDGL